jgi:hypothetical protein
MSPLLDSPPTENSARTGTDTPPTMPGAFRGTDGSNPVPSTGESANSRSPSGGRWLVCAFDNVDVADEAQRKAQIEAAAVEGTAGSFPSGPPSKAP